MNKIKTRISYKILSIISLILIPIFILLFINLFLLTNSNFYTYVLKRSKIINAFVEANEKKMRQEIDLEIMKDADAVKLIESNPSNILPDINNLPSGDKKTYELLCSGDTNGIFYLESVGIKDLLARIRPESIEDISACFTLYRPGPLDSGMHKEFINRRQGESFAVCILPAERKI